MPEQINLTFGIELEFICVHPKHCFNNQEPDLIPTEAEIDYETGEGDITAGHAMQYYLERHGIPATGYEEIGACGPDEASYSRWAFKDESIDLLESEQARLPAGHTSEPLELTSPILYANSGTWVSEIQRVLDVMAYLRDRYQCEFLTNSTTGFHVHIGNDAGRSMPFDTARRVLELTTALERAFDSMQAASRILAPSRQVTTEPWMLYAPLSCFHGKYDSLAGSSNNNVFDWVKRVENMTEHVDFRLFYNTIIAAQPMSGHACSVNFDNLRGPEERSDGAINTIEFRQHLGTLDHMEICSWVVFLTQLITFCNNASDLQFVALLLRATDLDFNGSDLARAFGCPQDVVQHYNMNSEPGVIGALPQTESRSWPRNHPLNELTEHNDELNASNTDRLAIARVIDAKTSGGYYGFDPNKGLMRFDLTTLMSLFEQSMRLNISMQERCAPATVVPTSRSIAFWMLGSLHRILEPGASTEAIAYAMREIFRTSFC